MKKPVKKYSKFQNEQKPPSYEGAEEKLTTFPMRLNRYVANAGVCSRREADKLIENCEIKVNGKVVSAMGHKVEEGDVVVYQKKTLSLEKFVYVLLNKPKDFITTTNDPQERRTVMSLVKQACNERIYPVGRLDRMTTGLLLLTNDGDLAKKLSHPSHQIRKIYEAVLDKPLKPEHFDALAAGFDLEDGHVKVDDIAINSEDDHIVGLEIHIGRNRIVRRMFEHFGYDVIRLDRVVYAGLTKIDTPRGKWRYLKEKELRRLKKY